MMMSASVLNVPDLFVSILLSLYVSILVKLRVIILVNLNFAVVANRDEWEIVNYSTGKSSVDNVKEKVLISLLTNQALH
jgi:hypothetical protein